ncbi:MAG: AAA family ATPase [Nostoc sp. RI_552]|jgi:Mrp family chromosome partitioning ATPase|nr:AAA family ATPase [Nostoc sp. RI_552]
MGCHIKRYIYVRQPGKKALSKIIVILNRQGEVGKTTVVFNVAANFAENSNFIIDADIQAFAS